MGVKNVGRICAAALISRYLQVICSGDCMNVDREARKCFHMKCKRRGPGEYEE